MQKHVLNDENNVSLLAIEKSDIPLMCLTQIPCELAFCLAAKNNLGKGGNCGF